MLFTGKSETASLIKQQIGYRHGIFETGSNAISFETMLKDFEMLIPRYRTEDLEVLTNSVHVTRLKNNPVYLSEKDLYLLYEEVINGL